MQTSRVLRAPLMPQMNDNGIIDNNDLVNGDIYVFIPPYSNMAIGDLLALNFGNLVSQTEVVNSNDIGQNIEFKIAESQIPDGIYTVNYTAIDLANNPTSSAKALAIISRDGTRTLDKPIFIDAISDVVSLDSVKLQEGTRIQVPPYQGIQVGDRVELNYLVYDTGDEIIPEASVSEVHTVVSADLVTGFQTLIPESKIFLPNSARAIAFYRVTRIVDGTIALSFEAQATLNGTVEFLERPHFPDAIDGWLTQYDVTDGIHVYINPYSDMAFGDLITLIWRGFDTENESVANVDSHMEYRVSSADISNNIINFILSSYIAETINLGEIELYYRVKSTSNDYRVSYSESTFINMSAQITLPAPTFPQATNNSVALSDIHADNGLIVQISYPAITIGDRILLVIYGEDAQGVEIPDNDSSYELVVKDTSIQNIILPVAYADALGDGGTLYATYSVVSSLGSLHLSATGSVLIAQGASLDFKFKGTSGSPVYDYDAVNVLPCNYGFVQAPVGEVINVSCQIGATILESNSTDYTFTIGSSGVGNFRVSSLILGDIAVSISKASAPSEVINGVLTFNNYLLGDGLVYAVANTTDSLPDGVSPCSIYIFIADRTTANNNAHHLDQIPPISIVTVNVPAPLRVSGYGVGESANINLHADGSAQIDIISDTAVSSANIIITSPQSSEVNQTISMSFSDF